MRELSLHILDVLENSLEAGATCIALEIVEDTVRNRLTISITDNGRGMDQETLARIADPFLTTRTTRHVGLGIPLFKAAAEHCNGNLVITSEVGVGTKVVAAFQRDHIDRAPLGDMKNTLLGVTLAHGRAGAGKCDLHYRHYLDERVFEFDTAEMREALGDVPLDHPRVRSWLEEYLCEGFAALYG